MVRSCSAYNCTNRFVPGATQTFHKFPLRCPERLTKWVTNVRRDRWSPNRHSCLCSDHFEEGCFDRTGQTTRLRDEAVPTIFDFSSKPKKVPKKGPRSGTVSKAPRNLKRKIDIAEEECEVIQKKTPEEDSFSQRKERTPKRQVFTMTEVLEELQKKGLVSNKCAELLECTFSSCNLTFALTLQFYSAKAYEYVRRTFGLCFPPLSDIRSWYKSVNGDPGFTDKAFAVLKERVGRNGDEGVETLCALTINEMMIRKNVIDFDDGHELRGYVDLGTDISGDTTPLATHALCFMVVSVDSCWKVPVAYFLSNGLDGAERANLVNLCLLKLHDVGVKVVSLTCDGPSCHLRMCSGLGAKLEMPNPQIWFPHPADKAEKVYVFMDVCDMLKLVRNAFAMCQVLVDGEGNRIKWEYIAQLHKLRNEEYLTAAMGKLRKSHWKSQNEMMVNLDAAVADAIDFCRDDLQLQQFQGSAPTSRFIRMFDRLFALLNSRNLLAKSNEAPMRASNKKQWKPFANQMQKYICSLSTVSGQHLYETNRKSGFVGLFVSLKSAVALYEDLVGLSRSRFLLTYKFTQDHLELFFSAILACGGQNNNDYPTASQFVSAYKRLLLQDETGASGNSTFPDQTSILHVTRDVVQSETTTCDIYDVSIARRYDLVTADAPADGDQDYNSFEIRNAHANGDHDYIGDAPACSYYYDCTDVPNVGVLSRYLDNAETHAAVYVARMVERSLRCSKCVGALFADECTSSNGLRLKRNSRGRLVEPSESVVRVCAATEICFKRILNYSRGTLPRDVVFFRTLTGVVLDEVGRKDIFADLHEHMFDTTAESNHIFRLIKLVAESYGKMRLHHLAAKLSLINWWAEFHTAEKQTGVK